MEGCSCTPDAQGACEVIPTYGEAGVIQELAIPIAFTGTAITVEVGL